MKITRHQLRKIIKESILNEEMLKIIANPYSPETEVFNRIANYALNNDIQAALADSEVNTPNLDLDIDEMRPWVRRVDKNDEQWMSDDVVVPDNWDADAVYSFMQKLENAWYDQKGQESDTEHQDTPDVKEREAIGGVLTQNHVLPDEFPGITYQVRRKGGKPHRIDIETRDMYSADGIDASWAQQHGTTIDKIITVLDKYGAKLRKKNPPRKYTPPMYD